MNYYLQNADWQTIITVFLVCQAWQALALMLLVYRRK
jgi:hypothetical protein